MSNEDDKPNMDLIKNIDNNNIPKGTTVFDLRGENQTGRINFLLRPRAVMYPMAQNTIDNPQKHNDYIIINCGKAEISAELEYGTKDEKLGVLGKCVLKPGKETLLETGDSKYEVTALRITNNTKFKAAFQVEGGETLLPPTAGEHYHELLDPEETNSPSVDVPIDGKSRKIEIDGINDVRNATEKLQISETDTHNTFEKPEET